MRITTYEKGGNSLNPFIKLSIFLMIILCLFVIPVSAESLIDTDTYTEIYGNTDTNYDYSVRYDFNFDEVVTDWSNETGFTNVHIISDQAYHSRTYYQAKPIILYIDFAEYSGLYSLSSTTLYVPPSEDFGFSTGFVLTSSEGYTVGGGNVHVWGTENDNLQFYHTFSDTWNYSYTSTHQDTPVSLIITYDDTSQFDLIADIQTPYISNPTGVKCNKTLRNIDLGLQCPVDVYTNWNSGSWFYDYLNTFIRADEKYTTVFDFVQSVEYKYNIGSEFGFVSLDRAVGIHDASASRFGISFNITDLDNNETNNHYFSFTDYENTDIENTAIGRTNGLMFDLYSNPSLDFPTFTYILDYGNSTFMYPLIINDAVVWNQDLYYTGETATISTLINNFDGATYSYFLDLYNTQEYLTTYEITQETESNYYTFPTEWTDTSLLAKLQRVTDPYGSNEVNLAMDLSHFETLNWDTTVSFDKSSYDPSETLTVTWSGAPTGSTVWLRAMDDGEIIKPNVDYSGSFQFTVPSNTQETYYLVDVIVNGVSQVQASCNINIGYYWVADYIYVSNYSFSDGDTYGLHDVNRAEYLNVTTETNINTDFVDVYYNNVYDDRMVSIDHIENLDETDQVLKFPNDLGSGQYITIIYYHNVTTGTQAELSYYTNVGEKGEGIDIYNAVITMDDTKEIIDIESIAGYGGNDLVVPSDRIIIFDIYADEIINSTIITEDYRYDGDVNYNSTADYHIKRSYLFDVLGLAEIQFEVHNDATNTDDIIKYNVYVQGIDQTDLDGSVVMYWTKSNIEIGDTGLLYFNVSGLTSTPTLTITSTTESNYATTRILHMNQTGTESVLTDEVGVYTAIITNVEGIVYAISTLTITDPTVITEDDIVDTTFQDNTTSLLNSPYLIGLFIMCVFLAIGATNGIGGTIVTGSIGLGIVCYMGIFPWILLVIEVLVVAALMAKGMIDLSGD